MGYWYILFIIILLFFIDEDTIDSFINKKEVCNDVDGRCYKVVNKYENQVDASKMLAELNKFSIDLMRHLRGKYVFLDDKYKSEHENIQKFAYKVKIVKYLLANYNPDNIIENAPTSDVNTSYVDDKGKVFALCLREKASGQNLLHKKEDLIFVVLHEMAHLATESFGHEVEFWTHFKFLLTEAKSAGLYEPINYSITPIVYCSLQVDYNPYFDRSLAVL